MYKDYIHDLKYLTKEKKKTRYFLIFYVSFLLSVTHNPSSYTSLQLLLTKTSACLVVALLYEFDFPFQEKYFSLTIMTEGQRVYVL